MNTNILRKCVEELKKETPNISYIQGMLETIIELSEIPALHPLPYFPTPGHPNIIDTGPMVFSKREAPLIAAPTDEEIFAEKYNGNPSIL